MAYRKWTSQEQVFAEVAAACGVSLCEIARNLNRTPIGVSRRLVAEKAKRNSENAKRNQSRKNRDDLQKYQREWRSENLEKSRNYCRLRRARQRNINELYGLPSLSRETVERRFALFDYKCAYCGSANACSVDHVVAVSKGGLDIEQNIVPSCKSCNCRKMLLQ